MHKTIKNVQDLVSHSDLSTEKKQELLVRLMAMSKIDSPKDKRIDFLFDTLYEKAKIDIGAVEEFFSGLQDVITSYIKSDQKGLENKLSEIEKQLPEAE